MQLPAGERTMDRTKMLARELWPTMDTVAGFADLGLDADGERAFRWRAWHAIAGLWDLEDPETVTVDATEQRIEVEVGGVPFLGIVDRLDRDDAGLVVTDYKSGNAPKPRWRADKLHQVLLYAAAVEAKTGEMPTRAQLLFLGQTIVDTPVTRELLDAAVGELADTWAAMRAAAESGVFEARRQPLCGWCPFLEHCEAGRSEVAERVAAGRNVGPGAELIAG